MNNTIIYWSFNSSTLEICVISGKGFYTQTLFKMIRARQQINLLFYFKTGVGTEYLYCSFPWLAKVTFATCKEVAVALHLLIAEG